MLAAMSIAALVNAISLKYRILDLRAKAINPSMAYADAHQAPLRFRNLRAARISKRIANNGFQYESQDQTHKLVKQNP